MNMSEFYASPDLSIGVNGSNVYTPEMMSNNLTTLFGSIVREGGDVEPNNSKLVPFLDRIIKDYKETQNKEILIDLFTVMFYTRDIKEGLGERDLFYKFFSHLFVVYPDISAKILRNKDILSYISEYGCYHDIYKIYEYINHYEEFNDVDMLPELTEMYVIQIYQDLLRTDGKISLAAKWLPREDKLHSWFMMPFLETMKRIIPEIELNNLYSRFNIKARKLGKNGEINFEDRKFYRKIVAYLTSQYTELVERKMCAGKFGEINPKMVPSLANKKYKLAFLDQTKDGERRNPDDIDRTLCREKFIENNQKVLKGESKLNASNLLPHMFVKEYEARSELTDDNEIDYWTALWNEMRRNIVEKLKENGATLNDTICLADFSGSMESITCGGSNMAPIHVSKGLALLLSEIVENEFKNSFITFDSNPHWHTFKDDMTIVEKLNSMRCVSQGTSTNIQKAMNLIYQKMKTEQIRPNNLPKRLLILTDMGWDQLDNANNYYSSKHNENDKYKTHIEEIKTKFEQLGLEMWGIPFEVPQIIVWNVSGKFQEYHNDTTTEGVYMISGWSPVIIKYLLAGENVIEKLKNETPYHGMRRVLDDERYENLRLKLSEII